MRSLLLLCITCLLGACATTPAPEHPRHAWEERDLERLASPELRRFSGQQEFEEYLAEVRRVHQERQEWIRRNTSGERIVVTGSRITNPPSITNNQNASVDEGDTVKRIGDYLLILQDGRVFATNFRTMQLTDRIDLYARDADGVAIGDTWYDEMLVHDDAVVVSTYSYGRDASEFRILRFDHATGTLEDLGTFAIRSYDYYSETNYTSRMLDGVLLTYLPVEFHSNGSDTRLPEMTYLAPGAIPGSAERTVMQVEASDVYRPVFAVPDPTVHLLIACDVTAFANAEADCLVRGFVGGDQRELYVDTQTAYLVTSQKSWGWLPPSLRGEDPVCDTITRRRTRDVYESAIFRLPHARGEASVAPLRAMPTDQFAIDVTGERLRILLEWPEGCIPDVLLDDDDFVLPIDVALVDVPLSRFGAEYRPMRNRDITPLPSATGYELQTRFSGDWLVYGARESRDGRALPTGEEPRSDQTVYAVSLADTSSAFAMPLGHQIKRLERLGSDVIVTGYDDRAQLQMSLVDLAHSPEIGSRIELTDRYESESRSHAFNFRVDADGSSLIGLPTVGATDDPDRSEYWSEEPSDMNYVRLSSDGNLAPLAVIEGADEFGNSVWDEEGDGEWIRYPNGYACEVSCIDWYGNARPIFIEERLFALLGTELVEAETNGNTIRVTRRLELAVPQTGDAAQ